METVAPIEDLAQVATRWQDTMLSLEKEYEQESEVLKIGEVAIGTLGNFSASIGKAKSKKTFNVSAMVAAALSGKEVLNYTTDFPEGKNRILYIKSGRAGNQKYFSFQSSALPAQLAPLPLSPLRAKWVISCPVLSSL